MAVTSPMTHDELVAAAERLAPVFEKTAREAEIARRPLDQVIDAVRDSGLFSLMMPRRYGGHEADLDTFFEVVLTLSQADTAMGWLTGFYIEHCFWFCGFPESFQTELFADRDHVLAPGAINVGAGQAVEVDGGYRVDGRWQWGTGIVHADWVLAGAMVRTGDGGIDPRFFALPREQVETVDTWHVAGMCATGSLDMVIDDVFVPSERAASMIDLVNGTGEGPRLHDGDLYRTPLMPILAFAAGTPILGAAKLVVEQYRRQTMAKLAAGAPSIGGKDRDATKPAVAAEAALHVDAAELVFRSVLAEVLEQRDEASMTTRSAWLARITHAVLMCRDAVQSISSVTGASGAFLDNPIQRALRDVTTASNHVVFDRESRYADHGRLLLDQPLQNLMV
ncbi:MAG: hypothetical protein AAGA99_22125 [Actinomycetota bacterium]